MVGCFTVRVNVNQLVELDFPCVVYSFFFALSDSAHWNTQYSILSEPIHQRNKKYQADEVENCRGRILFGSLILAYEFQLSQQLKFYLPSQAALQVLVLVFQGRGASQAALDRWKDVPALRQNHIITTIRRKKNSMTQTNLGFFCRILHDHPSGHRKPIAQQKLADCYYNRGANKYQWCYQTKPKKYQ